MRAHTFKRTDWKFKLCTDLNKILILLIFKLFRNAVGYMLKSSHISLYIIYTVKKIICIN